jgi:glycosyltransferase involved in cell wall biosynthesis
MRLLLSAYACRPNVGSEPGCGWNWATHFAARGIEVHALVAKRNQEAIEAGLRANPIANLHFNYVPVPYGWTKRNEALHYVCWQFAALKAARDLACRLDFDVVHHVTYASVHVPSQLWRLGIPVVFGPAGGGQTAPESMLEYFGAEKSKERRRSALTRMLRMSPLHRRWLRRMSIVLAANRDTFHLFQALGCKNISLMCDTAIPSNYFAQGPRKFEGQGGILKLLWVGQMRARKALPVALDALKESPKNVTLTIAGDGMDPAVVHRMIRDRNLEQRVFWQGRRLTWAELRTAYGSHDVMLFTSLRDSFGSQVLEAMAMGLPVITLDLHGAHDWVPDEASLKVPVGRPAETIRNLVAAIETYGSLSTADRKQKSMQAWSFAKTQTWSARAEVCENLYRSVLSKADAQGSLSTSRARAEMQI